MSQQHSGHFRHAGKPEIPAGLVNILTGQKAMGAHLTGVVDGLQQLSQELGGHQIVLSRQHKQAWLRQLLRPQALPVPHKLAAEGLQDRVTMI